jgi:hypothetical protein
MSKMSNLDAELRAVGIDPEDRTDEYFTSLGIKYVGRQKRCDGFPLDLFTDIVTGSSFLRGEDESVLDLAKRIQNAHTKR